MNHCYDCNSGYTKPGTCNCFAPGGKRAPQVVTTAGGTSAVPPYRVVPEVGRGYPWDSWPTTTWEYVTVPADSAVVWDRYCDARRQRVPPLTTWRC